MKLVPWTPALSVQVTKCDDQHRTLLDLINSLHEASNTGLDDIVLNQTFIELIDYTETHFQDEEDLMQLHSYPEFEQHRSAHQLLVSQVRNLQKKAKSIPEVMQFLNDWIVKHIQGVDMRYSAYLTSKGVR